MSRKMTIDIVARNEIVGWSTIAEPHTYTFTAVCLRNVRALSIDGTKMRLLMRDNPKIGYEILEGLISVVTSRLDETRHLLVNERLLVPQLV